MAGSNENSSPFNAWWAFAGALLALVVVGAAFLVYVTRDGGSAQAEAPATTAAAPPQTEAPASGCDVPAENQDYPVDAPETDWELYQERFTLPVSDDFGPVKRDGDLWQCFAHSPTGALFAGITLMTEFSEGQYDAAIDTPQAQSQFDDIMSATGDTADTFTVSGYEVASYSDSNAEITYGIINSGAQGSMSIDLAWDDQSNDWKLDLTRGGLAAEEISSSEASQLTPWSPGNG